MDACQSLTLVLLECIYTGHFMNGCLPVKELTLVLLELYGHFMNECLPVKELTLVLLELYIYTL